MLVRELFARLGLEIDPAGFAAADALFNRTKDGLAAIGTAVGAVAVGIASAIGTAAARAGEISDLAERTGVATDALQALDYGAKLAGVEIGELAQSFGFLSRTAAAAAAGSGEAQKAWAKAGVSIRDASGGMKSADTLLLELSDKFQGLPEGVEKTALAMQLLGRSGAGMLPFLNQGSAAILALQREARELGAVMDEKTIAAGDRLGDNIGRLMDGLKGLRNLIVGSLLEPLAAAADGLVQWMRANNKLIAAKVTPWLKAIGRGLEYVAEVGLWVAKTFGGAALIIGGFFAAWKMGTLIMGATKAFQTVSWAIALVIGGLRTLTLAELRAAAAGALIPLAWFALAAAVVLAYDEVRTFFRGGETLLGKFGEKWSKLIDDFLAIEADDWAITRWLKGALQALMDLDEAGRKMFASSSGLVRHDPNFKPTEGQGLPTEGVGGWLKRALGFEIGVNWEEVMAPQAAFGGGASPMASVMNSPGRRTKSAPGVTNVSFGDVNVHGTESPQETAALTVERLETEIRDVEGAVRKKR